MTRLAHIGGYFNLLRYRQWDEEREYREEKVKKF